MLTFGVNVHQRKEIIFTELYFLHFIHCLFYLSQIIVHKVLTDSDHWVCFVQLYNLYHVETGLSFRYSTKQLRILCTQTTALCNGCSHLFFLSFCQHSESLMFIFAYILLTEICFVTLSSEHKPGRCRRENRKSRRVSAVLQEAILSSIIQPQVHEDIL